MTRHELAARLHTANGRIYRATGNANASVARDNLADAQSILAEVIAELCAPPQVMQVIPRDRPFPI